MTTLEILSVITPNPSLEEAVKASIAQRQELQAAAAKNDEFEQAARIFDLVVEHLDDAQRDRLTCEQDILRYRRFVNTISACGGTDQPMWKLCAAKAAGTQVHKIDLRAIEQVSAVQGKVERITDTEVVIAHEKGKYCLPWYGGSLTVEEGEEVRVGTRVIKPEGATHAITKGGRFSPVIIGYANCEGENVVGVLVEGKAKDGYFTLLAHNMRPRYRFGRMVRGLDRLDRLVGGGMVMAALLPVATLREAADAAFGPCPQLPPDPREVVKTSTPT